MHIPGLRQLLIFSVSPLLLLLLFSPVSAAGQESFSLLLATRGNEAGLRDYRDLSVSIFSDLLAEQGIRAIPYEGETADGSMETVLTAARGEAAVFAALNTLTVEEDTISIETEFRYTPDGSLLYKSEASGSLSLGLERKLQFLASQASGLVAREITNRSTEAIAEDQKVLEEVRNQVVAIADAETETEVEPDGDSGLIRPAESADRRRTLRLAAVDVGAVVMLPLGRYRDFTDFGTGLSSRLALGISGTGWEFGLDIGGMWMHSIDPYANLMGNFHVLADAGYRFTPGGGPWSLAPRLSAGIIVHLASGDFNTLGDTTVAAYVDQLYGITLEASFEPWNGTNPGARVGFYAAPGFFIYPNMNYIGLKIEMDLGARIRLGRSENN